MTRATNGSIRCEFHHDSGHGWLQVTWERVLEFKLKSKISPFSYVDAEYLYLEEDCDAPIFHEAAKRHGYDLRIIDVNDGDESFIRWKPRYK